MKVAVFAYSRQGCATARKVIACFEGDEVCAYTMERFSEPGFGCLTKPAKVFYGTLFQQMDALVFVGSCGMAVREIAPHVKDKKTDPAVLVIDELGHHVIPLLSGHIGGANALAVRLSQQVGASAVITTATDINRKFSVDAWAAENGYAISTMADAKGVSAAILEADVPLLCDFSVVGAYPPGVFPGDHGPIGICISYEKKTPFERTLRLIPPILHLGIGCRKGTEASSIAQAVAHVLKEHGLEHRAIGCVASIDLKKEEAGLLQFCEENHWPVSFYSAETLSAVAGEFSPSEFVSRITGVDNVCERAAMVGAEKLVVRKTACNGVTVAVAAEKLEVRFG